MGRRGYSVVLDSVQIASNYNEQSTAYHAVWFIMGTSRQNGNEYNIYIYTHTYIFPLHLCIFMYRERRESVYIYTDIKSRHKNGEGAAVRLSRCFRPSSAKVITQFTSNLVFPFIEFGLLCLNFGSLMTKIKMAEIGDFRQLPVQPMIVRPSGGQKLLKMQLAV